MALALALLLVVVSSSVPQGVAAADPMQYNVVLADGNWSPNALDVQSGDTVRWCWNAPAPLNIVCTATPIGGGGHHPSFPFRSGDAVTSDCWELVIACTLCHGQTFEYLSDVSDGSPMYSGSLRVWEPQTVTGGGGDASGSTGATASPLSSTAGSGSGSSSSTNAYAGTGSAMPSNGLRAVMVLSAPYDVFVAQYEGVFIEQLALALGVSTSRFALLIAAQLPVDSSAAAADADGSSRHTELWIDLLDEPNTNTAAHLALRDSRGSSISSSISSISSGTDSGRVGTLNAALASSLYARLSAELSGAGTGVLDSYEATALIAGLRQVCADGRIIESCDASADSGSAREYLPGALVATILSAAVGSVVVAYLAYYYCVQKPRQRARQSRTPSRTPSPRNQTTSAVAVAGALTGPLTPIQLAKAKGVTAGMTDGGDSAPAAIVVVPDGGSTTPLHAPTSAMALAALPAPIAPAARSSTSTCSGGNSGIGTAASSSTAVAAATAAAAAAAAAKQVPSVTIAIGSVELAQLRGLLVATTTVSPAPLTQPLPLPQPQRPQQSQSQQSQSQQSQSQQSQSQQQPAPPIRAGHPQHHSHSSSTASVTPPSLPPIAEEDADS